MRLTLNDWHKVSDALELAQTEVHNQIATCPCPNEPEYAEDIQELYAEKAEFMKLKAKIDAHIKSKECRIPIKQLKLMLEGGRGSLID